MKINLLPAQKKQELKLRFFERKVVAFGAFLTTLILFLIICLAIIYLTLYLTQLQIKQSNALFNQAQELGEQVVELNQELSGFINQRLEYLAKIIEEQVTWSPILEKLAQIVPKNTRLESLEINNKEIKIGGYAETRDDVLLLQKILGQEKQFIDINSPLSNVVKQKNIDFYLSFKIKE